MEVPLFLADLDFWIPHKTVWDKPRVQTLPKTGSIYSAISIEHLVSDIAIFVLKRDVKLQVTN